MSKKKVLPPKESPPPRNQLDAVTDDVIRRGSCVFCGEAEETARHIVECALNPLLSRIMELPANEREWLSNPVAETELPPRRH